MQLDDLKNFVNESDDIEAIKNRVDDWIENVKDGFDAWPMDKIMKGRERLEKIKKRMLEYDNIELV